MSVKYELNKGIISLKKFYRCRRLFSIVADIFLFKYQIFDMYYVLVLSFYRTN